LWLGRRVLDPHQLLLASPLLQALEVAPDRSAHIVEVALFAHGTAFPAKRASPSERL
jgi:hypothetical protein